MIQRVEKTVGQFAEGSAQHTLQQNRLHALKVSLSLITRELTGTPQTLEINKDDLKRALAPIASLLIKSEKAILKLKPGSWQHTMLNQNIMALLLVYPILEKNLTSFDSTNGPEVSSGEKSLMNPEIIVETDRLIIRRFEAIDLMDLYVYLSDPEVVKFEPYKAMTLDEVRENLQWRISTPEMVAVQLKSESKLIGNVYLGQRENQTLELGFVFNRAYWGKGYAKEACDALIKQAFQNGVQRIIAECDPENTSSWRLLEALGFVREAHLIQNVSFFKDALGNPIWKDTFVYSKLKDH